MAQLDQTGLLAKLQHLGKAPGRGIQMDASKLRDRRLVWVVARRDHPESHVLVGLALDLPR